MSNKPQKVRVQFIHGFDVPNHPDMIAAAKAAIENQTPELVEGLDPFTITPLPDDAPLDDPESYE